MMAIPKTFAAGERLFAADLNNNFEHFEDASAITAGTLVSARLPAGVILQVVQAVKTDAFTTSSASYVDLTGLTQNITPRSTASKVLVIAETVLSNTTNRYAAIQLVRGSTALGLADAAGSRVSSTSFWVDTTGGYVAGSTVAFFLDSPNTTSSTTYKVQIRGASAGTVTVNRDGQDENTGDYVRSSSTLTLMEVAG
jgi:hypothetical protein